MSDNVLVSEVINLRSVAEMASNSGQHDFYAAISGAADVIDRLKSEIDRLTSERDAARHSNELLTLAVRTTEKSLHEEIARGIAVRNRAIEECAAKIEARADEWDKIMPHGPQFAGEIRYNAKSIRSLMNGGEKK